MRNVQSATGPGECFGPKGDRFELNSALDKGSQGTVFVCTRVKTGNKLAVKRVDLNSLQLRRNAGKVRKNLTREIGIMRTLHHQRIVNLIEAFWEGDVCFIVMDLARGGTVHDKLVPGVGLGNEEAAVYISRQLLDGIGYMHSHEVIHRDLKPANILINKEEVIRPGCYDIKIADFGLSKILNEPGGEKQGMTKVGTPAFAAPEIFAATYDEKADFWSFGCILFTMLCGEYPFSDMPEHIRHPKTTKVEILPCAAWDNVSEHGKSLTLGLLNADPSKRLDLRGCLRHPVFCKLTANLSSHDQALHFSEAKTGTVAIKPPQSNVCCQGLLVALGLFTNPVDLYVPMTYGRAQSVYEASFGVGVVSSIRGWSGSSVDSVELRYQNGERRSYGGEGGKEYKEWRLQPDELIIAVAQERQGDGYLGYSFVFFTSKGRSIAIRGTLALEKSRFVAPAGTQIVGLMFDDSRLCGTMIEKTKGREPDGCIASITGSVGSAVDRVVFTLRDGEERGYGDEDQGDYSKSWQLGPKEAILIAEQDWKDAYLGASLSFYTSAGNVFSLRGISATQSLRFMASAGEQICSLEFSGGKLTHVHTCSRDGNMSTSCRCRIQNDYMAEGESDMRCVTSSSVRDLTSPVRNSP